MDTTSSRHKPDGGGGYRLPTTDAFQARLRALRDDLELHLDPTLDGRLRETVLAVVDQGRADGLKAEQILVAFRQLWDGDPMVFRGGTPSAREELRWRIVSALISGYYDSRDGSAPGETVRRP